jgi:hypothetical protein
MLAVSCREILEIAQLKCFRTVDESVAADPLRRIFSSEAGHLGASVCHCHLLDHEGKGMMAKILSLNNVSGHLATKNRE